MDSTEAVGVLQEMDLNMASLTLGAIGGLLPVLRTNMEFVPLDERQGYETCIDHIARLYDAGKALLAADEITLTQMEASL